MTPLAPPASRSVNGETDASASARDLLKNIHENKAVKPMDFPPPSKSEPALRYDSGKVETADFIIFFDQGFAAEIGKALRYGAQKYGRDNWQKGMSWSRCINSGLRHLFSWARGEKKDKESDCHHLALLVCSIMFLFAYERDNLGKDDR